MFLLTAHLMPKLCPTIIILSILGGLMGLAISVYKKIFKEYGETCFAIGSVMGFFIGIII